MSDRAEIDSNPGADVSYDRSDTVFERPAEYTRRYLVF
jgi:hypothetical protein